MDCCPRARTLDILSFSPVLLAAAKNKDCERGLAAYDKAVELGVKVQTHSLMVLVHLCAGGDDWEEKLSDIVRGKC